MDAPSVSSPSQEGGASQLRELNATRIDPDDRLSRSERLTIGCLAATLAGLLVVGTWLSPSPSGMGTHQQMGLPPCTMLFLFGIRCMGCGMTTSWAYMLEGRIGESFQANSGGALLCLMALWATPIAAWIAYQGRPTKTGWFSQYAAIGLLIALGVALVEWIIRLLN